MDTPIRMKSRNIEKDIPSEAETYDDEIMCVGWNPSITLVQKEQHAANHDERVMSAHEMPDEDQARFLHNIYASMS